MSKTTIDSEIAKQRDKVFGMQPEINLVAACKTNDGVMLHSPFERKKFELRFLKSSDSISFFIPASGSGSRMFQFLFDFLEEPNEDNRSKTERFLNTIESFAFFDLLPFEMKERVREYEINLINFVSFLLKSNGLGLGELPKGLIPFHRSRSFVLNAFQEQLLQGLRLKESKIDFHFTINNRFEEKIKNSLSNVVALTAGNTSITYSVQDPATDSFAFDADGEPVILDNGSFLKRPSGHGALLENINQQDADILFIKNIDNVQHESKSNDSLEVFRYLGGLLQSLKEDLHKAFLNDNLIEALQAINIEYQLWDPKLNFSAFSEEEWKKILLRPIRVCGMVKNEGQPGGGPFWVADEAGLVSKQIVEKAQIKMSGEQYKLMVQSQYFNPVLMAVSVKNILGEKLNLRDYADHEKYFIVDKKYKGQPIKFMEKPGLWNGSMANWLTLFVEVPSKTFTPVKTVLDLLADAHKDIDAE